MQVNNIHQHRSVIPYVILTGIIAALCSLKCSSNKIQPRRITASSQLAPTASYSYGPEMLNDDKPSTAWAEGAKGDGIGESLLIEFGAARDIASMEIINGFAEMHKSLGDLYFANNRVRSLRLEFDDGTEDVSLRDGSKELQAITFNRSHNSTRVKATISGVYRGAKFNDTCISELQFLDPKQTQRRRGPTAPKLSGSDTSTSHGCACIYMDDTRMPPDESNWPNNYCVELPSCINPATCMGDMSTKVGCAYLEKCIPGTCSSVGFAKTCDTEYVERGKSCRKWR